MTTQPHRHARLPESTLEGIDRPPSVSTEQVFLVRFVRGEGCCAEDLTRECTAIYTLDGDLIGVIDPAPRTTRRERL